MLRKFDTVVCQLNYEPLQHNSKDVAVMGVDLDVLFCYAVKDMRTFHAPYGGGGVALGC